jgi:hypothetical protein
MSRCFFSAYRLNPAVPCESRVRWLFKLQLLNLLNAASATDNSDREPDLYDPDTDQGQFTDTYIGYRANKLFTLHTNTGAAA